MLVKFVIKWNTRWRSLRRSLFCTIVAFWREKRFEAIGLVREHEREQRSKGVREFERYNAEGQYCIKRDMPMRYSHNYVVSKVEIRVLYLH